MPKPKRGEVWLVRFPFTDLTSTKLRPALVWAVHGEDMVILGIFSRVPAGALRKTWVRIEESHLAFSQTGLKKTSLLRAEKIAIVHESVFRRKLGSLPPDIIPNYAYKHPTSPKRNDEHYLTALLEIKMWFNYKKAIHVRAKMRFFVQIPFPEAV